MTPHDANDEIASPVQTDNEFEMLLVTEISLSQVLKVFLKRRSKRTVALAGSPEEVRKALVTAEAVVPVLRHGQREALAKGILAAGGKPSNALLEGLATGRGRIPQDAFGLSGSLSIESVSRIQIEAGVTRRFLSGLGESTRRTLGPRAAPALAGLPRPVAGLPRRW